MKRISYLLLIVIFISLLIGCTAQDVVDKVPQPIRVASLKGPTSIGLVKLMDEDEKGIANNDYNFMITPTVDEIVALIGKGELDIAAIPANLSSILYNKTEGKISVAAINTLGVLYIVENGDSLNSLEDLKGKTIFSTGKGTTPEYVLNYILESNGIDVNKDLTIEYKSEATEVAALLASKENVIALLPQPFIAASQAKNENIKIAFDITEEWDKLQEDTESSLVTGVVIVNDKFLENNKEEFDIFLEEYETSVNFVNNNIGEASELVGKYEIIPELIAIKAIPLCNISFISGIEMQEKLSGYLKVLYNADPQSIGGQLPDEDFYFKK